MSPDQLREALDNVVPAHEVETDWWLIHAAARLALAVLEHGEEMEWCGVHKAPEAASEEPGVCWLYDGDKPCQIAPSFVIPMSALRDVDPNEEE